MARSFSNAKFVSTFIVDRLSVVVSRRGYAAASLGEVPGSGGARSSVMMKKGGEEATKTTSWVPDPVTGYYRPEGVAKEADAAELREMLLKQKTRRH